VRRNLKRLSEEAYDLLILGGGINGLAAAWDASLRGLRVALVEKKDFGAETSSATLKIVHGGLRYLQHLDFVRMRESIRERSTLLRIAPHLVEPFPFLVPTYGHFLQGKEAMTAAVLLNEIMSFDRNRRLQDSARRIPSGRIISKKECIELAPGIKQAGLTGGMIFHDAQMYNSERLTLCFALSAAEQGADLANYVEVTALVREGNRVIGAKAIDLLTGAVFDVRAKVTVNMTGPWSDIVLGLLDRPKPDRRVLRSKGIQIVAPKLTDRVALAVPSAYEDPDAILNRGARNFFITPWRGASLIGTTDTVYEGDPDDFRITAKDIADFVEEINQSLPSANLKPSQVPFAFGGLRPITEKNIDAGSKVARKYEVNDHASDRGIDGFITVIGVKYTTCRFLAEKVVDLAFQKLGRPSPRIMTEKTPLAGGNIERFDEFMNRAIAGRPAGFDEQMMRHLVRSYGSDYAVITGLVQQDPKLGERIPGSVEIVKAEVVHAVRQESALHLEDVILRRTDLGTLGYPGAKALQACADLVAAELGWSDAVKQREINAIENRFCFAD
jgi:glycerol-3-phosphate dehydrogenase